jgi:2-dehydro-3-deoxygluconokinase
MKMVCCFGELLLRLAPNNEWTGNNNMPVFIGGAELNTATALANWHIPVKYVTALPENYLSRQIVKEVAERNINTGDIIFSGNRIGTYYLPVGSELKNAGVIYDRANSSFSELKPGIINWKNVFADCNRFHFSAICPALNENVAAVCKEALEAATAMGLTISVDLNYRSKLWQYGKQPVDVMPELVKYCHVVMGNIWAAESLLGIKSSIAESKGKTKEQLVVAAKESMKQLKNQYPGASTIAYTFRLENSYRAVLQNKNETAISNEYEITEVADKVGSGDCFMAGIIYGLYKKHTAKEIVDLAAAAAVGKLNEIGDATKQTIEDIKK